MEKKLRISQKAHASLASLVHLLLSILPAAFAGFIVFQLILSARGQVEAFPMLQRIRMIPAFGDLRWFTSFSQCGVDIEKFYQGIVAGCDIYGRPDTVNTPFSVLLPRFLGIGIGHTEFLGIVFASAVMTLFLAQVKMLIPGVGARAYAVGTCLMGVPFLLAAERGSTDLVIYLLLGLLSCILVQNRRFIFNVAAPIVTLLVVLIKIYPLFGILGWAGFAWRLRSLVKVPRFVIYVQVLTAFLGMVMLMGWLHYPASAPLPAGDFISHGIGPAASDYFRPYFSRAYLVSAAKIIVLVASFVVGLRADAGLWVVRCGAVAQGRYGGLPLAALNFNFLSFFSWLGCYILTTPYDYRMIFLFPGLLLVLRGFCAWRLSDVKGWEGWYLFSVLAVWPFVVLLPFFYSSGVVLPAGLARFAWMAERVSDTVMIPWVAGSVLTIAFGLVGKSRLLKGSLSA